MKALIAVFIVFSTFLLWIAYECDYGPRSTGHSSYKLQDATPDYTIF